MSNFGIIQTINAPVLSSPAQPDLIRFEVEYAAYIQRINDANSTKSASNKIRAASIRQCMAPSLLQSLCMIGRVENADRPEDATDENVKKWFEGKLESKPIDLNERVEVSVSSVQFKQCKTDPSGAVERFISDLITALDRNNASSILSDEEQCKCFLKLVVEKLEPAELRQRIKNMRSMWTAAERSSLRHFTDKSSFIAEQVHAGEVAQMQLEPDKTASGLQKESSLDDDRDERKAHSGNKKQNQQKTSLKRQRSCQDDNWTKPCLNTECNQSHPISKCDRTSKIRRKELLDEYFKFKKRRETEDRAQN